MTTEHPSAPDPGQVADAGEFDFVIVGAGTAGCLLANRLSADPDCRVLLLEAGGADRSHWFRVPVGYRFTIGNPRYDWCLDSEPEPGLNGRRLRHPRGKVLGGCTAINGMVAIRGQAADYDAWRDSGLPGWGWDDLLPVFKRLEDHVLGDSEVHGTGGEWSVDAARVHWPVLDAVRAAAVEQGIPVRSDFNTGDNEGVGPIHVNQRRGQRWSTADAFLRPALARQNLSVRTGVLADRIGFDAERRARELHWRDAAGTPRMARVRREVLLAAGAFGSPMLLMRSGIGPSGALHSHGITPLVHARGVGANLHDHLQIALRWRLHGTTTLNEHMNSRWRQAAMALQWLIQRRGPLTMAPCQLGLFTRSSADVARADIGWNVLAFSRPGFDAPFDPFPGLTLIAYGLRPASRGWLNLSSRDPAAPPRFAMNFFEAEADRRVILAAMRQARRIVSSSAMATLQPTEQWPGPGCGEDDAALLKAARERASSIFHPVGSARMGPDGDDAAVVDAQLRVRGVQGVRVIDASVMPTVVSGNTATPTLVIAQKGADAVLRRG